MKLINFKKRNVLRLLIKTTTISTANRDITFAEFFGTYAGSTFIFRNINVEPARVVIKYQLDMFIVLS
jgi:hypothetical protein